MIKTLKSIFSPSTLICFLIGMALLLAPRNRDGLPVALHEAGVTLMAAVPVKTIFELTSAERLASQVGDVLRHVLQKEHGHLQKLNELGILDIFLTRPAFLAAHDIFIDIDNHRIRSGETIRVIGGSVGKILEPPSRVAAALKGGINFELCFMDSDAHFKSKAFELTRLSTEHLATAKRCVDELCTLVKALSQSLEQSPGPHRRLGELHVRRHPFVLFDSCITVYKDDGKRIAQRFCAWDWNFGDAADGKRVLVLDGGQEVGLGADVIGRYRRIWKESETWIDFDGYKFDAGWPPFASAAGGTSNN